MQNFLSNATPKTGVFHEYSEKQVGEIVNLLNAAVTKRMKAFDAGDMEGYVMLFNQF